PNLVEEWTLLLTELGFIPYEGDDGDLFLVDTDCRKRPSGNCVLFSRKEKSDASSLCLPIPFSYDQFREVLRDVPDAIGALSPLEERLLKKLKEAKGEPVPAEVLAEAVFGNKNELSKLRVYAHHLRKKIEKDGKKHVVTVHGKGYAYLC
ncbi:MAG: helix-turn-helix domain-containing protein, partial [Clostridia bacterium]|nr:helix-turn-helix domain-containing protein [Clostridia bacterium]